MLISKEDFAKYPFMEEAVQYVKSIDLKTDELSQPEFSPIVTRAETRIEEALIDGIIKWKSHPEYEIELLSYPVAVIFVSNINDPYLKRRYALAEAKRVHALLKEDVDEKLVEIANSIFEWKVKSLPLEIYQPFDFSLSFIDYLRNAPNFHDSRWKLVNKRLINGEVFLQKDEFSRLIGEEVRKHIEKTIETSPKVDLNSLLLPRIEHIKQMLTLRKERIRISEQPSNIISAAYPPCVKKLYDFLISGQHISHVGRFTLTSFLLNAGMKVDKLIGLYASISDFNQQLTRYQVEHIAGVRGSGTKYTPPSCETLKTHRLCPAPDDLCTTINHPLAYYRKKRRMVRRQDFKGEKR
jgi:DNA primase large subunit